MKAIRNSGPPIEPHHLSKLENEMGSVLPTSYRDFLLAYNGGRPTPDTIDIDSAPFKGTDVKEFLGINREVECENIRWMIGLLDGCKENQLLPIAIDSFGCVFVLALSSEEYGRVYYFNRVDGVPEPYLVANDFRELIDKLREPTPEELTGE